MSRERPGDGVGADKDVESDLDEIKRLLGVHDTRIQKLERQQLHDAISGKQSNPPPSWIALPSPEPNTDKILPPPKWLNPAVNRAGSNNLSRMGSGLGRRNDDPYSNMWAKAMFNKDRIFDQDLLRSIYDKPYRKLRNHFALIISGLFGLLSMPFGPIGMVIFAAIGALLGALVGLLVDIRNAKASVQESELVKKRLRSLVRWASQRQGEDEEMQKLMEMVTLEFRPIAAVADGSRDAQKMLRLLDAWIAQKHIVRKLWIYLDDVLRQWRDLERDELLRSMLVFQTVITTYRFSNRISKDEQEIQFIRRVEQVLSHKSVRHILTELQNNPNQDDQRVMEVMIFADAARRSPPTDQPLQNPCPGHQEDMSDDEAASVVSQSGSRICSIDSPTAASHLVTCDGPLTDKDSGEETPAPTVTTTRRVLSKPFFKNWDDFMDFDDTVKHKMPIHHSEFELLLEKEREQKEGGGWDLCLDRKEMKVSKKMYSAGLICLRAWATFPGVDLNTCFHLFYDMKERGKWDKNFNNCHIIAKDIQGCDLVYCLMRIPTVTPRDFLQYRRVRLHEDGSVVIFLRSAEHPNCPEDSRYIRVENKCSGYVFRQTYVNGLPVMHLFLMSCSDVKGMIPKWIINMLAPKKPAEWSASLCKAAQEHQAQFPHRSQEIAAFLSSEFSQEVPTDYEYETVVEESVGTFSKESM